MLAARVEPALAVVDHQPIHVAAMPDLVSRLVQLCRRGQGFTVFTLNLDHLVKRRRNPAFKAAYARATMVSADGWPIAALAKWQGAAIERVTGADLISPLCAAAAENGIPIYLFGSTADSLQVACASLRERHPELDIRGADAPPMGFDPTSPEAIGMAERIAASGAKLCFVALGAPKQEIFADEMAQRFPGLGFLCIGAALDFISGHQVRAPKLAQRLNIEWLWRLASNPRRMAFRYAYCALVFADVVVRLSANRGG